MKLLNTRTKKIKDFIDSKELPRYAILSHTWDKGEVTYQAWVNTLANIANWESGYIKIENACQQALHDGWDWIWVDTCCIDKSSSAELSEAINSMFKWYQEAACCYVYLADMPTTQPEASSFVPQLSSCRWFTRGWTLQELLAPKEVKFYSQDWVSIGTLAMLVQEISAITRIQDRYLLGTDSIHKASIARRMSWASQRQTTRSEDMAYCLLGIFNINMSLLYGEGNNAFQRLQKIMMQEMPEDQTLFAWGEIVRELPWTIPVDRACADEPLEWRDGDIEPELCGLLASAPSDFKDSGDFVVTPYFHQFYTLAKTGIVPEQLGSNKIRMHAVVTFPAPAHSRCIRRCSAPPIVQLCAMQYLLLPCGKEGDLGCAIRVPLVTINVPGSWNRSRQILYGDKYTLYAYLDMARTDVIIETPTTEIPTVSLLAPQPVIFVRRAALTWIDLSYDVLLHSGRVVQREFTTNKALMAYVGESGRRSFMLVFFHVHGRTGRAGPESTLSVQLVPYTTQQRHTKYGIDWLEKNAAYKPLYEVTFVTPVDQWVLERKPFPRVFIRVEKMSAGSSPSDFIYILDIVIQKKRLDQKEWEFSPDVESDASEPQDTEDVEELDHQKYQKHWVPKN